MSIPQPEMRGTGGREPIFNIPGVVIALIGLCVAVYVYQNYILSERQDFEFMMNFALIPARFSMASGFVDPAVILRLSAIPSCMAVLRILPSI